MAAAPALDLETRIAQAVARSRAYDALARLALPPDLDAGRQPDERRATDVSRQVEQAGAALDEVGYDPAAVRALRQLAARLATVDGATLARDHLRIFGHTVSTECPPYEAQYGAPHVFGQTATLADVSAFYRAFGLGVRPGASERLDHLGIELEFMHVLAYKEAYALEHHAGDHADLCREAERAFVRDHLGTWVGDFGERLAARGAQGAYAVYAEALQRYLAAECAHLEVTPSVAKTLHPLSPTPAPACPFGPGSGSEAGL